MSVNPNKITNVVLIYLVFSVSRLSSLSWEPSLRWGDVVFVCGRGTCTVTHADIF